MSADPSSPEALRDAGLSALVAGRAEDALGPLRRALGTAPHMVEAHLGLSLALNSLGRQAEALAVCNRAVILLPRVAQLRSGRAELLAALGRLEESAAGYDAATTLSPEDAELWARKADLLQTLGRFDAALEAYDRAIALAPGLARVWSNRAIALQALDRPAEAVESCERALAIDPAFVNALVERGVALRELNRPEAAIASFSAAAAVAPDNPLVLCNLAVAQLLAGDLPAGFRAHEHRWRMEPARSQARNFDAPLWLGDEDIAGKTLLLHAEQGFGDTIQFCRYAPMAKALGARVMLGAPAPLLPLLSSLDGVDALVAGDPLPPFDLHCPLMSLPLAFGATLETIPAPVAYLAPPPERVETWGREVSAVRGLKVGLAWFGKPTHKNDRNRSLALARLMEALPDGVELFSLHDRTRPEDAVALAASARIRRFEDRLADFADTAALASMMDVVVSVDTSIAHLAAAIGRPTFVLLPFAPDWRWLLGRDDSPWYPTMRLFRQAAIGDWSEPLADLRQALERLAV